MEVHLEDLDLMGVLHNAAPRRWRNTPSPRSGEATAGTRPGPVTVRFWCDLIGRTSHTYAYRILSRDNATLYAEGTRVQVNLGSRTLTPRELSTEVRAIAEPHPGKAPEATVNTQ
ncbi:hypothetical protein AB0941_28195 [Streptomyces sp. NPDC013433]|uniref:hypothetical protein n=1 Tax=Streptomyces sp. NPDC013433 TaxID=3155604 RepID=UPI003454D581